MRESPRTRSLLQESGVRHRPAPKYIDIRVSRWAIVIELEELTWVMPVRETQKEDSLGRHVGLTKLRNSATFCKGPTIPLPHLSAHLRRHTGHSCTRLSNENASICDNVQ